MSITTVAIGMAMVLLFFIFDRKTIRIEWDKFASFVGFMSLVTCIRLALYDTMMRLDSNMVPQMHQELLALPKILLTLVWWEDGFFVLPIFLAFKYLPKKWAYAVAFLMSLNFGLGHMYQGLAAVFITGLYPYFLSYRYGKKYGFGTVMCSHVFYDFITYFTVILAPMLL